MTSNESAVEESISQNPYAAESTANVDPGDVPLSFRRRCLVESVFLLMFAVTTTLGWVVLAMAVQLGISGGLISTSSPPTQSTTFNISLVVIAALGLTIAFLMRGRIQKKLRRVQKAEQNRAQMSRTITDIQLALDEKRQRNSPESTIPQRDASGTTDDLFGKNVGRH